MPNDGCEGGRSSGPGAPTRPNWSKGSSGGPTGSRSTSSRCWTSIPRAWRSSAASRARMLDRAGFGGRTVLTGDRDEAIDGAAFVIVQLRVGGQAARLLDETIPLRFGCIGQETTGAGGFAKALRTVPVVLELAELAARRGAPGCWFIDFTNPTGLVTQALLDVGHPRDRPVQRRDQLPAPVRRALRGRPRAGGARARRAEPPVVGSGGEGRRGRPAARAPRRPTSRR